MTKQLKTKPVNNVKTDVDRSTSKTIKRQLKSKDRTGPKECRKCRQAYANCKCERHPPVCHNCGMNGHKKKDCRRPGNFEYQADPDRASGEADARRELAVDDDNAALIVENKQLRDELEKKPDNYCPNDWYFGLLSGGKKSPQGRWPLRFFDFEDCYEECPAPYPLPFENQHLEPVCWTKDDAHYQYINNFTIGFDYQRRNTPFGVMTKSLKFDATASMAFGLITTIGITSIASLLYCSSLRRYVSSVSLEHGFLRAAVIAGPSLCFGALITTAWRGILKVTQPSFTRFRVDLARQQPHLPEDKRALAIATGELVYEDPKVYSGTYTSQVVDPVCPMIAMQTEHTRSMEVPCEVVEQVTHPGIDQFTDDQVELASKIQYTISRVHAVNLDKNSPLSGTYHSREAALLAFGVVRRGEQQRLLADFRWSVRRPP